MHLPHLVCVCNLTWHKHNLIHHKTYNMLQPSFQWISFINFSHHAVSQTTTSISCGWGDSCFEQCRMRHHGRYFQFDSTKVFRIGQAQYHLECYKVSHAHISWNLTSRFHVKGNGRMAECHCMYLHPLKGTPSFRNVFQNTDMSTSQE